MRQITELATSAFFRAENFKRDNTEIKAFEGCVNYYLHGNLIATWRTDDPDVVVICDGGWQSNTTKERLNSIPGVSICQKNWVWYLNNEAWDGEPKAIVA